MNKCQYSENLSNIHVELRTYGLMGLVSEQDEMYVENYTDRKLH
jgi:hypothetical protein